MKQVKLILAGAGCRGQNYSRYALEYPDQATVVGVAEPRKFQREQFTKDHEIASENIFCDWKEMAEKERFADAVIIATQDDMHTEPAIAFAKKGYDILLEKPMAPTADECKRIIDAVREKKDRIFAVCHVLRYTEYTQTLKKVLDEGAIGDIVSMQHLEPVGYWHFAHSFVRGNWRNEAESSPMLLAKACHDLDWVHYIMGSHCTSISSYGNLKHFKKECKPEGAGDRCTNCSIEKECPYSAIHLYIRLMMEKEKNTEWPVNVTTDDTTREGVMKALREGPYGRCVYNCDNDVCDHQVVNMLYEDGKTASLTVTAFTSLETGRRTSIFGTKGEIYGDSRYIKIYNYMTHKETVIDTQAEGGTILSGHGGGDFGLMRNFVTALQEKNNDLILTGPRESLDSHLMVFDAEISRTENKRVNR